MDYLIHLFEDQTYLIFTTSKSPQALSLSLSQKTVPGAKFASNEITAINSCIWECSDEGLAISQTNLGCWSMDGMTRCLISFPFKTVCQM